MKRQESFEELLRTKLDQFEAEPPAFVFDQIEEALGNKPVVRVLPWYKTVASRRIAAAAALLLVAGTVYWVSFSNITNNHNQMASQLNDTIQQLQLQNQLQALELAGQQIAPLEENNSVAMQPPVKTPRLDVVSVAVATEPTNDRNMNTIETIPSKSVKPLVSQRATQQLLVAAINQTYISVDMLPETGPDANSGSAIANTFTKLSSGQYFELAKQKVNDFVSKEHYVNFAIGNVEFGQTIQLSK